MVLSMNRWKDRVAVVTGACSGVGAAVVRRLLNDGVIVVGIAQREEKVKEISNSSNLYAVQADVSKETDLLKAFEWIRENLGPIHILVNTASISRSTNIVDGNTEMWKEIMDVNFLATCITTREAVKDMRNNDVDGHIVNVNGLGAQKVVYYPTVSVQASAKYATKALAEVLRAEFISISRKIKISNVSPGLVSDEDLETDNERPEIPEIIKKYLGNNPPLQADDIAKTVIYVLSTPPHCQVYNVASIRNYQFFLSLWFTYCALIIHYQLKFVKMVLSMQRWKGKVAVVTGASSGIGAALTLSLLKEGLIVVGIARRKEKIQELSTNENLYAVRGDITKEEDVLNGFKWIKDNLGPIHILVNSAGVLRITSLIDGCMELWKYVIDANVMGLCIATREAIKTMREYNIDGHIVHVNSIVGHKVINFPNLNVLCASKHAVTALTETLRLELNSIGSKIKISSVSPGIVNTKFVANACGGSDQSETSNTLLSELKNSPSLNASDVADAILYVLSTPLHVQIHELIIKPLGEAV
ncbi:hypothetical protein FQA39_LY03753 [Lamprigera yunnana]|nr:hypothetical protein FQA39_LY03753 [Lamprigera yunnana]